MVLRRLAQGVAVLGLVLVLGFLLFRFAGDPVNQMVGLETGEAERAAMRQTLGLDEPPVAQFATYVRRVASGDLGGSFQHRRPVAELLVERFPATVELAVAATVLAVLVALPIGVLAGAAPAGTWSRVGGALALVGASVPTFLIGLVLIAVFSVTLPLLPPFGRGEVVPLGRWSTGLLTLSGLRALVLPAATLALYQAALLFRVVRSEVEAALDSEHARFARARGLPEWRVLWRHALPNAAPAIVTVATLQFGAVLAFAIVTESVFQWPGLGLLFVEALAAADLPVMAAYLMVVAIVFLVLNLIADLAQLWLDPRATRSRASEDGVRW